MKGLNIQQMMKQAKKLQEEMTDKKDYAVKAIGDQKFMRQILETEFTQGLPEEYSQAT